MKSELELMHKKAISEHCDRPEQGRNIRQRMKQIRDSLLQSNQHSVGERSGQRCSQYEQWVKYGTRHNRERGQSTSNAFGMSGGLI